MKRRDFLKTTGSSALAAMIMSRVSASKASALRTPIGLQLFTVMFALEHDFEQTMKSVAEIGYREVETIGTFGRDPAMIRDLCQKYGLVSPSQHLAPEGLYDVFKGLFAKKISEPDLVKHYLHVFRPDNITAVIDEGIKNAKLMGQTFIVWPILFEEQLAPSATLDQFIKAFNIAGDMCAREGLIFTYHNHDREFKKAEGVVPYDVILQNTNPKTVKMELDFYWATKGGASPAHYFKTYPDRYKMGHLKDMDTHGNITNVGEGTIDFPELIKLAKEAGIKHYYVENDNPSANPVNDARISYNYLKKVM